MYHHQLPLGGHSCQATKWAEDLPETNWTVETDCPTRARKRIHIPGTILGSKRSGQHKARGIWHAHIRQEGKGVLKVEGNNRWGRRVGKTMPGGCKDRIFQGMQKFIVPGATMDKTNGNKIFQQGKTAVGEG